MFRKSIPKFLNWHKNLYNRFCEVSSIVLLSFISFSDILSRNYLKSTVPSRPSPHQKISIFRKVLDRNTPVYLEDSQEEVGRFGVRISASRVEYSFEKVGLWMVGSSRVVRGMMEGILDGS